MPIRRLINVKTAAQMISLFRNERANVDKTKEVQAKLDPWRFWLIQNRRQCKKVNVFSPETNECRKNVKVVFWFLCRHDFRFLLFFHIICTIVFRRFLGIINVGCLEFHCYVAFLQNTSSGIPHTESVITLFGSAGKYSPKYIFNENGRTINFESQPNWVDWIVWIILFPYLVSNTQQTYHSLANSEISMEIYIFTMPNPFEMTSIWKLSCWWLGWYCI